MTNKFPESTCTKRASIHPGMPVDIVLKADQPTGKLTRGVVKRILTNSPTHPRGIKVMLEDGQVGRVQRLAGPQECRKCRNRIVLHAFSDGFCQVFGRHITCADTPVDVLCGCCAATSNRCVHCGAALEPEDSIE